MNISFIFSVSFPGRITVQQEEAHQESPRMAVRQYKIFSLFLCSNHLPNSSPFLTQKIFTQITIATAEAVKELTKSYYFPQHSISTMQMFIFYSLVFKQPHPQPRNFSTWVFPIYLCTCIFPWIMTEVRAVTATGLHRS